MLLIVRDNFFVGQQVVECNEATAIWVRVRLCKPGISIPAIISNSFFLEFLFDQLQKFVRRHARDVPIPNLLTKQRQGNVMNRRTIFNVTKLRGKFFTRCTASVFFLLKKYYEATGHCGTGCCNSHTSESRSQGDNVHNVFSFRATSYHCKSSRVTFLNASGWNQRWGY